MVLGWDPDTPEPEWLWLEDPTHQPSVVLAPELQPWENPPEVGELWLGGAVMSRYSPQFPVFIHMHPHQDLGEGVGQGGQEEGMDGFPGMETQITVPVGLVRYRNASGIEQLCDRTQGEPVGWRREVWGLVAIFKD